MKMNCFQFRGPLHQLAKVSIALLSLMVATSIHSVYGQEINKLGEPSIKSELRNIQIPPNVRPPAASAREVTDNYPFPPIWNVPVLTQNVHVLIVMLEANPRINNIPLVAGDYIGAFYVGENGTLVCGGADVWYGSDPANCPDGNCNIVFPLMGDDNQTPNVKDGFAFGEVIHYRIFSFTTMKDYQVDVMGFDTSPNSGYISGVKWYPLSLSASINLEADVAFDVYADAYPNPMCIGDNAQLYGVVFVGSGGPYTFDWVSNPAGFTSTLQNPYVNPNITTQYTLTAHDGNFVSQHTVTITVNDEPSANAGIDGTVCGNQNYQLSGSALHYSAVNWTTSGNGVFSNASSLTSTYTPGSQDIASGQVTLSLHVQPLFPCDNAYTDNLSLTVLPTPTLFAGDDRQVCGNDQILLNAQGNYFLTLQWTTSGTGTFTQPNSAQSQYLPSVADLVSGSVTLSACASSGQPCVATACDALVVTFLPGPTASAPATKLKCENQTVPIAGSASNYSSILWTTAGDGSFNNPAALSIIYTPGPNDRQNGGVVVTLNVFPLQPCTTTATKQTVITLKKLPVANAGNTNYVCKNGSLQLAGAVSNYNSFYWSTLGDGFFSNSNILNPVYFPGANDKTVGNFRLILTATPSLPCSLQDSDTLHVTIVDNPTVQINTPNNQQVCQVPSFQLNAQATSYSQVIWTTDGDGAFNNANLLNAGYNAGAGDVVNGLPIKLSLTASAISPCSVNAQTNIFVTFKPLPTVNAGVDATICQTGAAQLSASAQNDGSVVWTTSGSGTFSNIGILNPVYTPGPTDISSGTVTLTMTASAVSPCTVATSDNMILVIQKSPVANAGNDATICQTGTAQLSGSAQNNGSVAWTTSGNGAFSNTGILNPVYTPGPTDISSGTVTLTMTASAVSPCTVATSDNMILVIQKSPIANAGADATICQTGTAQLSASAQNNGSVAWTTAGSGTFSNTGILNPVYTPGPADITSGTVTLTMTASAVSPCTVATSDNMILVIQKSPIANAGNDATICQTGTAQLSASAQNNGSVTWATSGNGTFSNMGILNPVYAPGPTDISSGTVILTMTASAVSPCTVATSDNMILVIQKSPIANAGADATICQTGTAQLSGSAQNNGSVAWTTSGNGAFSNTGILNPVYTPGPADITSGTVTLTMTASAVSPCTISASDSKILIIQKTPVANAGVNDSICETGTYQLSGTAQNNGSVTWTTSGSGSFNNASVLNPVYTPGIADISNGVVTLTLTVSAISPCTVSSSDAMVLIIQKLPYANAGADATICQTGTAQLSGTAQYYGRVNWITSGDGTFGNTAVLNPVYTPGATDIMNGTVILSMGASAVSPCMVAASDDLILQIQKSPVADAGADVISCGSTSLNGSASDYQFVLWSTSGDGAFNNPGILNPDYTPGSADISNGTVVLSLTASAILPCTFSSSDDLTLTMDEPYVVSDLVTSQDLNVGEALQLEFYASSGTTGIYEWYHDGVLVEGANSSVFLIPNVTSEDAGHYYCAYSNNCGEVMSFTGLIKIFQASNMQMILNNGWSGISTYVQPNDPDPSVLFAPIIDNVVIVSNQSGVFWPSQNINTLGNWSVTRGYKIKMLNPDLLMISGNIQYPSSPLTIPQGWSYLPVNSVCANNVLDIFGQQPSIKMIKEIAGWRIYWPEQGINTLDQLYPGMAYEILNSGGSTIEIQYPKCDVPFLFPEQKSADITIQSPWNEVHHSSSTHVFGFSAEAVAGFEPGDIIGAFDQTDHNVGIVEIVNNESASGLAAFIDDEMTIEKDGLLIGETVGFKLYRPSTYEIFDLDISYASNSPSHGEFAINGISVIEKAEYKSTFAGYIGTSDDVMLSVFPNPVSGLLNVEISSNQVINGTILLSNSSGQNILIQDFSHNQGISKQQFNLSDLPKGVYYLKLVSDKILKVEKIIAK